MSQENITANTAAVKADINEEWSAYDPEEQSPQRLITVTKFPDEWARSKTELTLPFPEGLVELIETETASSKAGLPFLKLAAFNGIVNPAHPEAGCLRYDAAVTKLSGIEAEHDAGEVSIEEVVQRLQRGRVKALVYPSPSHRPEKPKWRVLTPYAGDYEGDEKALREYRNRMLDRLNGVAGGVLTGESWTLSQSYYFGGVGKLIEATIIEGDYIDERDDLDEGALDKKGNPGGTPTHEPQPAPDGLDEDDEDGSLLAVARRRIKLKIAKPGMSQQTPTGNGTMALAAWLLQMRHGDKILSAGKIAELIVDEGWTTDYEAVLKTVENAADYQKSARGCEEILPYSVEAVEVLTATLAEQISNPPAIPSEAPAGTESACQTNAALRCAMPIRRELTSP